MKSMIKRRLICFLCALLCAAVSFGACAEVYSVPIAALGGRTDVELDDGWFSSSSYNYNHALMRASLLTSLMAIGTSAHWGESGDFGRDKNARTALEAFGFADYYSYKYDVTLNDSTDSEAFVLAHRRVGDRELIIGVARCSDYGCGFSNNFHIGEGGVHAGFGNAGRLMAHTLMSYAGEHCAEAPLKIWLTGYSRAAATVNVAAAELDGAAQAGLINAAPQDIFTYSFATPTTVREGQAGEGDPLYDNIFSIVNERDVVPVLPLPAWGYTRYGVTRTFGGIDPALSGEEAALKYESVVTRFSVLTGKPLDLAAFNSLQARVDDIADSFYRLIPSVDAYVSIWEELLVDFINTMYLRVNKDSVDPAVVSLVSEKYADTEWGKYILDAVSHLNSDWKNNTLLAVLLMYGEDGVRALSSASGTASLLSFMGEGLYYQALAFLACADIQAQRVSARTGMPAFMLKIQYAPLLQVLGGFAAAFEGHTPSYYMAFLQALDEEAAFGSVYSAN
ncbi:MAG: hypothetical protein IKR85_08145 [Clostridia bacterium]|nr:hypothetical protein [Clostridia bacterium]